jgi:hypothetical protein
MKYALLLYDNPAAWESVDEDQMKSLREEYMAVADEPEHYGGAQLKPGDTAKTIRASNDSPVITDGPFTETKEILSGFYLIDAETEERALELAARIPTVSKMGGVIELRPIVER